MKAHQKCRLMYQDSFHLYSRDPWKPDKREVQLCYTQLVNRRIWMCQNLRSMRRFDSNLALTWRNQLLQERKILQQICMCKFQLSLWRWKVQSNFEMLLLQSLSLEPFSLLIYNKGKHLLYCLKFILRPKSMQHRRQWSTKQNLRKLQYLQPNRTILMPVL